MDLWRILTSSILWVALLSVALFAAGVYAVSFMARRSELLKPMGLGLTLVTFFVSVQVFLRLGGSASYPSISKHLDFYSWLLFTVGAVRLGLYVYGDLFVVRLRRGSFPAAFKNTITAAAVVVAALILLKEILSINLASLIATTTVLTATIGLAFQSTLANMLAGLTIHLEKPLRQGDWIAAGGHEGRVLDITLRSTRIKTIENNEVFIPNSRILNEAVVNYSMPSTGTIRTLSVGVSYGVPPNKVRGTIRTALAAVGGISGTPEPVVRVTGYQDFSINYEIRYAIDDFSRRIEIESEVMNLLWYHFKREGIEIPFPIRNVNVTQVTVESKKTELEKRRGEITALMKNVEILSPLTAAELARLVDRLEVKHYAAGETVIRQGAPGDSFYIIKNGTVDVVIEKDSGGAVVASLGPGNFFGEMSLLTGAVRTASIRVRDDAEFIVIGRDHFRETLSDNPSIAESLSCILSERQAGLAAGRERLDESGREMQKRDASTRMLSRIKQFFGLAGAREV